MARPDVERARVTQAEGRSVREIAVAMKVPRTSPWAFPRDAHEGFASRAEARSAIFDFIEVFYNRRHRHSFLGYLCPVDFEKMSYEIKTAA